MFSLGEQFVIIGTYVVDLWHIGPNLSILQNHIHETCVQFNVSVQNVYSAFFHSTFGRMSKWLECSRTWFTLKWQGLS